MATKNDWYYLNEENERWEGPYSRQQLDELRTNGTIEDRTEVIHRSMMQPTPQGPVANPVGMPYHAVNRIALGFSPTVEEFLSSRQSASTTVLSGPNNSGKSLLLKYLFTNVGEGSLLVACNRFSQLGFLSTRPPDLMATRGEWTRHREFIANFYRETVNRDDSNIQLEQTITGLKNRQRNVLFRFCQEFLGSTISLKSADPENEFSSYYIDIDGENLSQSSTGTRLLLTLLGICLDSQYHTILIDEPELGLSPKIQSVVSRLLYDPQQRQEHFPHLRQLYVATHSHLLLDRKVLSNNFIVARRENTASVEQVRSIVQFHQLQFNMLGNDLESLFLPAAILIVEGPSDISFLSRLLQIRIPDRNITIVSAHGDAVLEKLNVIKALFGDLDKSPYANRVCVLLDRQQSVKLGRLKNMIPERNVVVWPKNGIEYYYPESIVAQAFCCDPSELSMCKFESDPIEFNHVRKTKKELAQFVADRLTADTALAVEVETLLKLLKNVCQ